MMEISYFWFGQNLKNFLFEGLTPHSIAGFVGICVAIVAAAVFYESINCMKRFLLRRFLWWKKDNDLTRHNNRSAGTTAEVGAGDAAVVRNLIRESRDPSNRINRRQPAPRSLLEETDELEAQPASPRLPYHPGFLDLWLSSLLHAIYMFLGFTLMNAVMTFNVWIFIAVCVGLGIGYFVFGNYREVDHLLSPLLTETTSLNDSDPCSQPCQVTGGGDAPVTHTCTSENVTSTDEILAQTQPMQEPGETSKLIVGADVHVPRIVSSSGSSI